MPRTVPPAELDDRPVEDESLRAFVNKTAFLPTYESYPYDIQRVDAARYFVLHHYGGAYMDLDVGCRAEKDLGDFLCSMERSGKSAVLPLTHPVGFSNDVLFATKGSPFFKGLMDALPGKNKWYGSPYLTVMYRAGPMFVPLQYAESSRATRAEVSALPPRLYSERGTRYFKHLRGGTWHQNDARAIRWMVRNGSVLVVLPLLSEVACTGVKQIRKKHENKRV